MTSFRSRPRFSEETLLSAEEICNKFKTTLDSEQNIVGQVFPTHILLRIKAENRHVWSPQLSLDFEKNYDDKMVISGVYGPMPSIWSKFAFIYFTLGCIILFAGIIGGTQLMLNNHVWVMYLVPICVIGMIITYLAAQTGQKLGVEETFMLHHFYEETLQTKVHIH
ncbi:hypothetical protein OAH12_02960 [Cyclobacteriaceae bacterium]|nr:hypothetical protein [Cyclobacteriaceae bacterium]